jgi:hypothetical protein
MPISAYAKAIVGFIAPAATVIVSSVTAGSDGGSRVTSAEIITAVCAAVITAAGVFSVTNRPQPPHAP